MWRQIDVSLTPEQIEFSQDQREKNDALFADKAAMINRLRPLHRRLFASSSEMTPIDVAHDEALSIDFVLTKHVVASQPAESDQSIDYTETMAELKNDDDLQSRFFRQQAPNENEIINEIKARKKSDKKAARFQAKLQKGKFYKAENIAYEVNDTSQPEEFIQFLKEDMSRIVNEVTEDKANKDEYGAVWQIVSLSNRTGLTIHQQTLSQGALDKIRSSEQLKTSVFGHIKPGLRYLGLQSFIDERVKWIDSGILSPSDIGADKIKKQLLKELEGIAWTRREKEVCGAESFMAGLAELHKARIITDDEASDISKFAPMAEEIIISGSKNGGKYSSERLIKEWAATGLISPDFKNDPRVKKAIKKHDKIQEDLDAADAQRRARMAEQRRRRAEIRGRRHPVDNFLNDFFGG